MGLLVKPRYTVGTVTGWPITRSTIADSRNQRQRPSVIAYVYDSAYCYRPVAEFTSRRAGVGSATALEAAQALADQLNEAGT
jgi:hypothetical protein